VLILDEPTSAIDSKTESVILDALENLMEGRTSFMIAHRLSTIRDANLILVLNHGRLVEQGSHEQLLAQKGLYYQLYEAQTGRAAAIEAQYAQAALAADHSSLGVSDIIAEVATAEALARYEGIVEDPEADGDQPGNGAGVDGNGVAADGNGAGEDHAEQPAPRTGLWAPIVPQPGAQRGIRAPDRTVPPVPPSPPSPSSEPDPADASAAQAQGGTDDITDKVIETLTDAVRQRIRAALDDSTTRPAPDKGADGSNGAGDQGRHGPDEPGPSPHPADDDPRV
jgi:hypothetical protein